MNERLTVTGTGFKSHSYYRYKLSMPRYWHEKVQIYLFLVPLILDRWQAEANLRPLPFSEAPETGSLSASLLCVLDLGHHAPTVGQIGSHPSTP